MMYLKIIECIKCTDLPIYHTMKLQIVLTLTVLSRNLFVECIKSIKKEGHFNDIKTSLSCNTKQGHDFGALNVHMSH